MGGFSGGVWGVHRCHVAASVCTEGFFFSGALELSLLGVCFGVHARAKGGGGDGWSIPQRVGFSLAYSIRTRMGKKGCTYMHCLWVGRGANG